jgi:hypothetical protein
MNVVTSAFGKRLRGEQPSRTRAVAAAGASGVGVGALVYRLLRSSPQPTKKKRTRGARNARR